MQDELSPDQRHNLKRHSWHAAILLGQGKESKHFSDKQHVSGILNSILKNILFKRHHRHVSQTPEIHVIFKHWLASSKKVCI